MFSHTRGSPFPPTSVQETRVSRFATRREAEDLAVGFPEKRTKRNEAYNGLQLLHRPTEPAYSFRQFEEFGLMITSVHTLIYSEDALGGGAGWLIFKTGRSEMGVHPTHNVYDGKPFDSPRHHPISLMCDDISKTVAELNGKAAEFHGEVQDHGYGLVLMMAVPGADEILLYEPKHPLAYSL